MDQFVVLLGLYLGLTFIIYFLVGIEIFMEQAILGGGCFWCMEPVFRSLTGIISVTPGFSGGHVSNPTYQQVCRQDTGHVEVVQIDYDPNIVSFKTILEVFFGTHNPTTLNRQGEDVGPQYASVIFYKDANQKQIAQELLPEAQEMFDDPIVTRLEQFDVFWPAEQLHEQYYMRNPEQSYCQLVIAPKIAKFRQRYAHLLNN